MAPQEDTFSAETPTGSAPALPAWHWLILWTWLPCSQLLASEGRQTVAAVNDTLLISFGCTGTAIAGRLLWLVMGWPPSIGGRASLGQPRIDITGWSIWRALGLACALMPAPMVLGDSQP